MTPPGGAPSAPVQAQRVGPPVYFCTASMMPPAADSAQPEVGELATRRRFGYLLGMHNTPSIDAGTRIDSDLEVLEELGAGGMGRVFLARDAVLDRNVAVKLLMSEGQADPDQTDEGVRAVREARAVARVVHPNVAAVYRIGSWQERPYIEMEWVDGPSLRDVIDERPLPPTSTRWRWLEQIGAAVQHAHDEGFVHGDVS